MAGFGASIKLTGENEYRKALKDIQQNMREVSSSMKLASAQFKTNDKSVETLAKSSAELSKKLAEQKKALVGMKDAYAKMASEYTDQQKKAASLRKSYDQEESKLKEIEKTLGSTSKEYQDQAKVVADLEKELDKETKTQDKMESSLSKMKVQINNTETSILNAENKLDKFNKDLEGVGKEADKAEDEVGKLGNTASKTANKFDGFKNAGRALSGVGTAAGKALKASAKLMTGATASVVAAATAVTKKLVDVTNETAEYGDEIDKNSKKMGISAKSYQEWSYILERNGSDISKMGPVFKKLAIQTDKGNEAFQKLGISQKELQNLSQEDLFSKVITGLQSMEKGASRTKIANDLLGKGATELGPLFDTSAKDTEKLRKKVNELGGVMSNKGVRDSAKYKDTLTDLKTSFGGLKRGLGAEFMPAITQVMRGLSGLFSGNKSGLKSVSKGIQSFTRSISEKIPEILQLGKTIVEGLGTALMENLPTILSTGISVVSELVTGIIQALPELATAAGDIIGQLGTAIVEALPQLVDAGHQILDMIISSMTDDSEDDSSGQTMMENIATALEGAIEMVPKLFEIGGLIIEKITDGIQDFLDSDGADGLGETIFNALSDSLSAIFDIGANTLELAQTIFDGVVDGITSIDAADYAKTGGEIYEGFKGLFEAIDWEGLWEGLWTLIGDSVCGAFNLVGGFASGLAEDIGNWWDTEIANDANGKSWGENLMTKIGEGLDAAATGVTSGLMNSSIGEQVEKFGYDLADKAFGTGAADYQRKLLEYQKKDLEKNGWWHSLSTSVEAGWKDFKRNSAIVSAGYLTDWNKKTNGFVFNLLKASGAIKDFFAGIPEFFKGVWSKVTTFFNGIPDWFKGKFDEAVKNIKGAFSGITGFFSGIWTRIKETFGSIGTKIGDTIGGAFKKVINGVLSTVEGIINKAVGLINGAIGIINKVPGVDITKLSDVKLPRLAKGGLVDSPTLAQVGEAGKEAILPLEHNKGWIRQLARDINEERTSDMSYKTMVKAFREALTGVKVELDDDEVGRFVIDTVSDALYA